MREHHRREFLVHLGSAMIAATTAPLDIAFAGPATLDPMGGYKKGPWDLIRAKLQDAVLGAAFGPLGNLALEALGLLGSAPTLSDVVKEIRAIIRQEIREALKEQELQQLDATVRAIGSSFKGFLAKSEMSQIANRQQITQIVDATNETIERARDYRIAGALVFADMFCVKLLAMLAELDTEAARLKAEGMELPARRAELRSMVGFIRTEVRDKRKYVLETAGNCLGLVRPSNRLTRIVCTRPNVWKKEEGYCEYQRDGRRRGWGGQNGSIGRAWSQAREDRDAAIREMTREQTIAQQEIVWPLRLSAACWQRVVDSLPARDL